ncbi:MAG: amidase family protein, partial [Treponema sp.]|nr:amidase family protein [Treponema sp.]
MSDADLIFSGPRALAAKVAAREISARELVEASLRRIAAVNGSLNAFRVVMEEEALAAADAIDARGEPTGVLAGVPLAVKDDVPLAGQRMTLGSRASAPVQDADAEFIRRLRAAGAIP